MTFKPRIGVYICHCGINISANVDVAAVSGYASKLSGVEIARDYTYMCSEPGQEMIKRDIVDMGLNRVVVASCSPRMHEPTFQSVLAGAGINPYGLEMANIREHCSWVHQNRVQATLKAIQLVAATVEKTRRLEELESLEVPVVPAGLVIGGGVAGMQAAIDLSQAGFKVTLVECTSQLGGHVGQLAKTFPSLEDTADLIAEIKSRIYQSPNISVLTDSQVTSVKGYVGNFQAQVSQQDTAGECISVVDVAVGTVVVATGFEPFDARRKPEFGYGVYPQVITTLDFEQLAKDDLQINGRQPQNVVFIQCVGSRDKTIGNPYCSRVCCMVTAKQALTVRQRLPQSKVTVFYMDVRAFGKGNESFYDRVRKEGVLYRRGNPAEVIQQGDHVIVRAEDTLIGELVEEEADLVVLAVGMMPNPATESVAGLFKLSRSADGFLLEAHPKMRPVDTAVAGIFLAGCCQGPKDITDTVAQARAAASAALIPLLQGRVKSEAATSFIDEDLCSGCGQCATVCPFGALTLHPVRQVMRVNSVLCQGCGACGTACPSSAINLHHYTFEQMMAMVESLSAPFSLPLENITV
jgi:heterodisulfide reductase subunit A